MLNKITKISNVVRVYINKWSYIGKVLKYALMIFHIFIASGAFELTISVLDFDLLPLLENNYSYTVKDRLCW
jgi:hypothetical protein